MATTGSPLKLRDVAILRPGSYRDMQGRGQDVEPQQGKIAVRVVVGGPPGVG